MRRNGARAINRWRGFSQKSRKKAITLRKNFKRCEDKNLKLAKKGGFPLFGEIRRGLME
jgi:hypothetical protein